MSPLNSNRLFRNWNYYLISSRKHILPLGLVSSVCHHGSSDSLENSPFLSPLAVALLLPLSQHSLTFPGLLLPFKHTSTWWESCPDLWLTFYLLNYQDWTCPSQPQVCLPFYTVSIRVLSGCNAHYITFWITGLYSSLLLRACRTNR